MAHSRSHIAAIIIGVLVLGGIVVYKVRFGETHSGVVQQVPLGVSTSTIKEDAPGSPYSILVHYPKVHGLTNAQAEADLNGKLQQGVESEVVSFKTDAGDAASITEFKDTQSTLEIDYETALITESLVSFDLITSEYIVGSAHPNSYETSFNYDAKNGKELALGDLFIDGADYLGPISRFAVADLKKQLEDFGPYGGDSLLEEGAAPKAENYQVFLITKDALVIIFNPYQVGPRPVGAPRVEIPWSELKDIVDPQGAAASF